jgi:hypothetical protein
VIQTAVAKYNNKATDPRELPFSAGQVLIVIKRDQTGTNEWTLCRLGDKTGMCPLSLNLFDLDEGLVPTSYLSFQQSPVSAPHNGMVVEDAAASN